MAKDPAFLFYTGDFCTGSQFMTDDQLGKYLRLLMAQHQHGHLSEKQVLHICKSYDSDVMKKFIKDEQGLYYNIRLEHEINVRKNWVESRSKNKLGKSKTKKSTSKKPSKSYDSHMEDKDESKEEEVLDKKRVVLPFSSDAFKREWGNWLLYRAEKKISYKGVVSEQAALKSLSEFSEDFAIMLIKKSMGNGWQGLIFDKTKQEYEQFRKTFKRSSGEEVIDFAGTRNY